LKTPQTVEFFKAYYGYAWYRASYRGDQPRRSALMFTDATDRIRVYQNGKPLGVFGRGAEATRDPLPVQLEAGENRFVFLCDNMGRISEGNRLDPKGIGGPVYLHARESKIDWKAQAAPNEPPVASWRFLTYRSREKANTWSRAQGEFAAAPGQTMVFSLRDLPQYAWLFLNGKPLGEHAGSLSLCDGVSYGTFVVEHVPPGTTQLELVAFGEPINDVARHLKVFACPRDRALTGWGFRAWAEPANPAAPLEGLPVCWEARFPKPAVPGPLFFDTTGLSKGHVYLNGRAAGRYWHIGPQKLLYLPEPWFGDENRLVVFDEEGKKPSAARLVRDANCPTRMVLA
jgi:hypothetical protein